MQIHYQKNNIQQENLKEELAEIILQSVSEDTLNNFDSILNFVNCFYYSNHLDLPNYEVVRDQLNKLIQLNLIKEIEGGSIILLSPSTAEYRSRYTLTPYQQITANYNDYMKKYSYSDSWIAPAAKNTTTDVVIDPKWKDLL